ncbi:TauD/TfdA dioxygenase family protein [Consotaella aegiceratis]|uniref:TauD/TfdA dioxygenase family protein n=1 Tax=Consotaella aegiceratis TaxID=3097961 RepID=UPI002F421952
MDLRIPKAFLDQKTMPFEVDHVTPGCGAILHGVDVTDLSGTEISAIQDLLACHGVVFIENQDISPDQQQAFAARFGTLAQEPFVAAMPDAPYVTRLLKGADEQAPNTFGGVWHTDLPFLETPPAYTILYGVDIPETGGDTLFSNTRLAYENLSDTMREILKGLQGVSTSTSYKVGESNTHFSKMENMELKLLGARDEAPSHAHPLVADHPVSGSSSIYLCPSSTKEIEGLSKAEAAPLLSFLTGYITDPFFSCRYRWKKGTLAMWDNRVVIHRALSDFLGSRREMHRCIVIAA